jgi:serine protease Do
MKTIPTFALAMLLSLAVANTPWARAQEADDTGPFAAGVEYAQKRVVKIYGATIGRSPGYATGIIVSPDGQILTAAGVFLTEGTVRVTMPDGTTQRAEVIRRSENLQSALLKVNLPTPDYFTIPTEPAANKGDWVLAVSNAFKVADGAEPLSVNIGVLSLRVRLDARRGYTDFPYHDDVYLIDAITSNPGASGGAVVNAQGQLVGLIGKVIEGKTTGTRLNYAIPADLLKRFLHGDETPPPVTTNVPMSEKGELGIRLFALGGRKSPAYIDRVIPGSAAAQAGLKTDDLIISINGELVRDAGDFRRLADEVKAGVEITIEVKRKNELLSVKVTPTAVK